MLLLGKYIYIYWYIYCYIILWWNINLYRILSYNNSEAFTTVYLIIPSILSIIPGIILIFLTQNIHDQMGIRRRYVLPIFNVDTI